MTSADLGDAEKDLEDIERRAIAAVVAQTGKRREVDVRQHLPGGRRGDILRETETGEIETVALLKKQ